MPNEIDSTACIQPSPYLQTHMALFDQTLEIQGKVDKLVTEQAENSKIIDRQTKRCELLNEEVFAMSSQLNEILINIQRMKISESVANKTKRRRNSILAFRRKSKQP